MVSTTTDAIAVLRAARKLLARKGVWVPWMPDGPGQQCLFTALETDAPGNSPDFWRPGLRLAVDAVQEEIGAKGIGRWNDRQKSVKPVLSLIDRAIRRLERES